MPKEAQKVSIGVSIEAEKSWDNFSFVRPLQLLIPLDSSLLPTPYSLLPALAKRLFQQTLIKLPPYKCTMISLQSIDIRAFSLPVS